MGDLSSSERRLALRVPVRGVAVFHREGRSECGAMYGTIENLSSTGALVDVRGIPSDANHELELKLGGERGWVNARTVRVERTARRVRIAVAFDRVDERLRAAIDTAIEHAIRAAERRPTLIVDERSARRTDLIEKLAARGMTPLVPKTPLDAIDLLTRAQLHVCVCLLAPGFGQTTAELKTLVAESFPWVTLAEISDDLDDTADRALDAWTGTDVARFSSAIA